MKKYLIWLLFITFSVNNYAATPKIDSVAIGILDHMTYVIGSLNSVSYDLRSSSDVANAEFGHIKNSGISNVYMRGPDKMLINSRNDKGHREFWYNGKQMVYFSYDENNYAVIDAPSNIIAAIDTIHNQYGLRFPGADFFYPSFTDDLIEHSDQIQYLGKKRVNGKECFHIIAISEKLSIQIWISNDGFNMPVKLVIINKQKEGNPQYQASFSNWKINPDLPEAMFEFLPPPGAIEIKIIPKKIAK